MPDFGKSPAHIYQVLAQILTVMGVGSATLIPPRGRSIAGVSGNSVEEFAILYK